MKFDITQQQVFPSLVTLLVTSVVGMFIIANGTAPDIEFSTGGSLLGNYVDDWQLSHRWLSAILASIALFHTSMWLGRVISTQNLYNISTTIHIPMIGVMLWCVTLSPHYLLSAIVVTLSTYVIGLLLKAVSGNNLSHLFNAMFALSLLPLFYPSAIFLFLAIPMILFFVSITLREWIVGIVGALLPIFGACYIYWLMGNDFLMVWESTKEMLYSFTRASFLEELPLFGTAIMTLAVILSLLSIFWFKSFVYKSRVRFKCALVVLVVSLATLLSPSFNLLSFALIAPAAAILTSLSLVRLRGRTTNYIYLIFVILLLLSMIFRVELGVAVELLTPILNH